MSCTTCVVLVVTVCALFVCILAYLLDAITVSPLAFSTRTTTTGENHPLSNTAPFPDGRFDNLFWFVHVSDLHISKFYDPQRIEQLRHFCKVDLKVIKPELVIVSGDLTDAKHANNQGSEQYPEEWETYASVLEDSQITNFTKWLDLRGNHDAFDVPSLQSEKNMFRKYSNQGKKHLTSYHEIIQKPFGNYSFIGVDSCPNPGPKRPFNFFGILTQEEHDLLVHYKLQSNKSNSTVWFGHYPTSLIRTPHPGIRHLMRDGIVYLCGHLHTLGGLVPNMYTRHKTGNLELELGDWKDNRLYRILAYDHDLLSFVDETFGTWPVILITNPKNSIYNLPLHEPIGRIANSSHIRVLVFSPARIKYVDISMDGTSLGEAENVRGPLYVLPWQPKDYNQGIHSISVIAKDTDGNVRTRHQPFYLHDMTIISGFRFLPRLILMTNISALLKLMFLGIWMFTVIPLIYFAITQTKIIVPTSFSGCLIRFVQNWLDCYYDISTVRSVCYPWLFYNIYVAVGPWFIGEIIDGSTGACFVYGVFVHGTRLPMDSTFLYGTFLMMFFNIPLTLYLGSVLRKPCCSPCRMALVNVLRRDWLFVLVVGLQSYSAVSGFYLAYGTMAFLISPMRTWSVPLAIFLRHKALSARTVIVMGDGIS